ncbi:TPM domain-containing protein [Sediminicola luteus]|uniref:Methanol dehydrogenase n=1 Tax=Sediminicola luteus TaxID=319238 RepID=A0A2A4GCR5_9FLAO|nr:TPM domain-containing protein [Sediminicola luteus]PCE65764.1 methanol dehydrogenase [Sediminicola luteus]
MRSLKAKILLLGVLFWCGNSVWAQFDIPKVPTKNKQTAVYDYVGLLSSGDKALLSTKLLGYADTTSTQIVIIAIPSTQGEDINQLAAQWGHKWGIGQADKDNGIVVMVAKNDRKMAISTGYGTEHLLTDLISKRIIDQVITPRFKQGQFYEGLNAGTTTIMQVMSGEYTEDRDFSSGGSNFISKLFPLIIFFIILYILSRRRGGRGGRGPGGRGGGFDIWDAIILSNMGRSSGGGWSSGGGGSFGGGSFGGGFGGGGFGGGGASGGW